MGKRTKNLRVVGKNERSLGELIHLEVRRAIETAVREELEAALGSMRYERLGPAERAGYRNGVRTRTLTGPTGPVELAVPRARLFTDDGGSEEWRSTMVPRYQRRLPEVNEAVASVYLSGGNTRRIKGALRPLLKDAPLSKSAVSRIVGSFKGELEAWRKRSLGNLKLAYVYLDAIALRVRTGGKVVSVPVLVALGVLSDGTKRLLSLEMCNSESRDAWKGVLDDLVERQLARPKICIVDGNAGLRAAIDLTWPQMAVQRCTVHKLRNLMRKAPTHAVEEIKDGYHRIVYAQSLGQARTAREAFVRKWKKSCPGVVASLEEAGDELLTFFAFPPLQWKSLRTTNQIERLNEEFRRRVKTQGSFPSEDSALVLLYSLVTSGQISMRKIDGHEHVRAVLDSPVVLAAA